MAADHPLDSDEELFWRALLRLVVSLPRTLDGDLERDARLSLSDYAALLALSEVPDQQLRLADLAAAVGRSASRVSRLVDSLAGRGLVAKERCCDDGRGSIAVLTPEGLGELQAAVPAHMASVRHRVIDHLGAGPKDDVARILVAMAAGLADRPPSSPVPGPRQGAG